MLLKRGDRVRLTIGTWTIEAGVALASTNGRSLLLFFDGIAPLGDAAMLGSMAVLAEHGPDDYIEICTSTPVRVEPVEVTH